MDAVLKLRTRNIINTKLFKYIGENHYCNIIENYVELQNNI